MSYQVAKKFDDTYNRFDTMPQTDRRIDGQKPHIYIKYFTRILAIENKQIARQHSYR